MHAPRPVRRAYSKIILEVQPSKRQVSVPYTSSSHSSIRSDTSSTLVLVTSASCLMQQCLSLLSSKALAQIASGNTSMLTDPGRTPSLRSLTSGSPKVFAVVVISTIPHSAPSRRVTRSSLYSAMTPPSPTCSARTLIFIYASFWACVNVCFTFIGLCIGKNPSRS